jgi:hypothetical protein
MSFPGMVVWSLAKIQRSWRQSYEEWHHLMDELSSFSVLHVDAPQPDLRLGVPRKLADPRNEGRRYMRGR